MYESELHWIQVSTNQSSPMAQGTRKFYLSPFSFTLDGHLVYLVLMMLQFRYSTSACLQRPWILSRDFCNILRTLGAQLWVSNFTNSCLVHYEIEYELSRNNIAFYLFNSVRCSNASILRWATRSKYSFAKWSHPSSAFQL